MAQPIVRISKGRFASEKYPQVRVLIEDSAKPLVPAIQNLRGLLYYHAAVDPKTNTVVNVSVWEDADAARQMDTLREMLRSGLSSRVPASPLRALPTMNRSGKLRSPGDLNPGGARSDHKKTTSMRRGS
jgi:hypothetical protein